MTAREVWRWTDERGVQRLVGTDELRSALASSVLPSSTLVWREGMKEWAPASSLPELASAAFAADAAGREGANVSDEPSFDSRSTQSRRATLIGVAAPVDEGSPAPPLPVDVPSSERYDRPGVTQIPPFGAPKPEPRAAIPKLPAPPMVPKAPAATGARAAQNHGAQAHAPPTIDRPYRKIATSEIDGLWASTTHSDEDETLPRSRPSQLAAAAAAAAEAAARGKHRVDAMAKRSDADRAEVTTTKASPPLARSNGSSALRPEIAASPDMPSKRKPPPLPPKSARKPPPPPPMKVGETGAPSARATFTTGPLGVPVKPVIAQVSTPVRIKPPPGHGGADPGGPRPLTTTLHGIAAPMFPVEMGGDPAYPPARPVEMGETAKPPEKPSASNGESRAQESKREGAITLVSATSVIPEAEAAAAREALARPATPPPAPVAEKRRVADSDRAPPMMQSAALGIEPKPEASPPRKPDAAGTSQGAAKPPAPPRAVRPKPASEPASVVTTTQPFPAPAATGEAPNATADAASAPPPHAHPHPPHPPHPPHLAPAPAPTPAPPAASHADELPRPPSSSHAQPSSHAPSSSAASLPLPPSSSHPPSSTPAPSSVKAPSSAQAPSSRAPASVPILRRKPDESEMTRVTRLRPDKGRRGLGQQVPVPISSLVGAGGVLIGMVVAAFFAGRASAVPPPRTAARVALQAVPAQARAALPTPPKPCWMTKQPARWADKVFQKIPFEVTSVREDALAVGYAQASKIAVGIEVGLASGDVQKRFEEKGDEEIEHVTPATGGEFRVARANAGGSLKAPVESAAGAPFAVGLADGSIAIASPPNGAPAALWPLAGEDALNAASIRATGARGFLLTYRRGGSVWGGFLGADKKAIGDLVKIAGVSATPGKPASGWNGREIAVIFADRATDDAPWEIHIGHAPAPRIPANTVTFALPKGGPGRDAISPDIAGLPDGRWVIMWTEGASGSRAVRAQTLAPDFTPLGDPIALSPPAGNFGQGTIGVAGGYTATVFLQKGAASYELWGSVLQCN